MRAQAVLGMVAASALSGIAAADTAPIGPGDPTWAIRSVLGYSKTGGNTDNSAGSFLFRAAHVLGDWKLLFGIDALYGSTRGETTAQAWDGYLQGNYNLTQQMSDRLALSAGYKVIDNSNPPPGSGHRDTLTTLGVVYELKNEKLPPE